MIGTYLLAKSKSSTICVTGMQDKATNSSSGCIAGHCLIFCNWSLEASKQILNKSKSMKAIPTLMLWSRNAFFFKSMYSYFPYSPGHYESYSFLCAGTKGTPVAAADAVSRQGQTYVPCMENSSGIYKILL